MTTADRGDLESKVCPFCGRVGGLTWDYASRSVRCSFCYVSGIEEGDMAARSKTGRKREESAPSTKATKAKHVVDDSQTVDAVRDEKGNPVYIVYQHQLDPAPPDLYLSLKHCQFQRWLLRDQIRNEARYGRDNLRKRGFRVTDRVRHQGRVIKVLEQKPNDE